MIPGSNLLNQALSVIASQTINYYQASGRSLNSVGQDITTYNPVQEIQGSFQPVQRSLYAAYGLDLQKSYFNFYVSTDVLDVQRDISGDQIAFQGLRYQCESSTPWFGIDGWNAILCVLIGDDPSTTIYGFNEVPTINDNVNFERGNFLD